MPGRRERESPKSIPEISSHEGDLRDTRIIRGSYKRCESNGSQPNQPAPRPVASLLYRLTLNSNGCLSPGDVVEGSKHRAPLVAAIATRCIFSIKNARDKCHQHHELDSNVLILWPQQLVGSLTSNKNIQSYSDIHMQEKHMKQGIRKRRQRREKPPILLIDSIALRECR